MSDFSKKQPKPQPRTNDFDEVEAGAEATGFKDAPREPLAHKAAGPGVPANKRKIH